MKLRNNVLNLVNSMLVMYPTRKSLNVNWNWGSMLGMILLFQIVTGTMLSIFYVPRGLSGFDSVQYIMYEVNCGWLFRIYHFNGASFFFLFLYMHFFKGLVIISYRLKMVWFSGLLLILISIAEAFIGYVIVWAQMSYWAAVVITSLLGVIPV